MKEASVNQFLCNFNIIFTAFLWIEHIIAVLQSSGTSDWLNVLLNNLVSSDAIEHTVAFIKLLLIYIR